jgi:hypothetical protein
MCEIYASLRAWAQASASASKGLVAADAGTGGGTFIAWTSS